MQFLLHLPVVVSIIIISVVTLGFSAIGLKLVRKRFSHEVLKENHEVAGFIYNAFMLIYAVLLAFVVFVSWTDYNEAKKNAEMESNLIVDIFSDAKGLPDTMRTEIRRSIAAYVKLVIEDEWEQMDNPRESHQRYSAAAREEFAKLWNIYFTADVSKIANLPAYQEALGRLNDLGEYRRARIFASGDTIPGMIWLVLIVCAVSSVAYTFFFGVRNIKVQYVLTFVLTFINTLILYLIFVLDHPFKGSGKISRGVFRAVYEIVQQAF
jgi:hypothetical protein